MIVARLVADDAFLAVERVLRKTLEQNFRDQILRQDIDLELDVVRGRGVDRERFLEMRAEQFAGGASRFLCHFEEFLHRCTLTDSALPPAKFFAQKKPGEENEFSSRVEVNVNEERFCHRPSVDERL